MNNSAENQSMALARRDDLVVQEMPDEILIYDLKQHKAHCLNHTAAFVWNHCDGQTTAAGMAELMEIEWGKPVGEDVVWIALDQLSRAELLQERVVRPEGSSFSRRAAIRKLGLATALALPLVISIVAPTAAAIGSIPIECQACVKKINGVGSCPNVCGPTVLGACYDNSGCGAGQMLTPPSSVSCTTCFSGTVPGSPGTPGGPPLGPGGLTISWSAPN